MISLSIALVCVVCAMPKRRVHELARSLTKPQHAPNPNPHPTPAPPPGPSDGADQSVEREPPPYDEQTTTLLDTDADEDAAFDSELRGSSLNRSGTSVTQRIRRPEPILR